MIDTEKTTGKDSIIKTALDRFRLAETAEADIRRESLEDLKFRAGEQWPEEIKRQRELDGRPCITINRIPQFIRQVSNEQRQNRPSVKIHPVDDSGDVETAEVMQGLIRHIEANSDADIAYDTAVDHAATMGFGYFRVVTEYLENSFDQEIYVRRVRNPFSVYFDPFVQAADYSDARFAFIVDRLSWDDFKRQYPKSEAASAFDLNSIGDGTPGWMDKDGLRIAEYFYVETVPGHTVQYKDGSIDTVEKIPDGAEILNKRPAEVRKVKWCLITCDEVLEQREWPGKYIPILPVLGEELDVDGDRRLIGLVRFAKEAQRTYNYQTSAEVEAIALAPRAPFIGAIGQFEGREAAWGSANVKNAAYLEYKPVGLGAQLAPPPQRQVFEPAIQAISQSRMQAAEDMKATTGIYDASLGARSNEQSGRAIVARQKEGDVANFHFVDNLQRAIRHLGRILIDLIPRIYDAPRVVRIIGDEDEPKTVAVNQRTQHNGVERVFDLSVGRYDVVVSAGPSYATKRQEAADGILNLVKSFPALMQVAGDLLVKNLDLPGAMAVAERIKKALPPGLADDDEKQKPIPPAVQAQLQQSGQMVEALSQEVHTLQNEIDTKKVELESRERIAMMQEETKRTLGLAQLESQEGTEMLRQEIAVLHKRLDMAIAQQQAEDQRTHEAEMQTGQQEHAAGMEGMKQDFAAQQAAAQPAAAE